VTPDDLAAIRADIAVLVSNHDGCTELACDLGEAGFSAVNGLPALLAEVDRLREERDAAIAHDRQPYPTAWAYEQACRARDEARAEVDDLCRRIDDLTDEVNGLLAERARIRAAVEGLRHG
jgi:hypothetical protein